MFELSIFNILCLLGSSAVSSFIDLCFSSYDIGQWNLLAISWMNFVALNKSHLFSFMVQNIVQVGSELTCLNPKIQKYLTCLTVMLHK